MKTERNQMRVHQRLVRGEATQTRRILATVVHLRHAVARRTYELPSHGTHTSRTTISNFFSPATTPKCKNILENTQTRYANSQNWVTGTVTIIHAPGSPCRWTNADATPERATLESKSSRPHSLTYIHGSGMSIGPYRSAITKGRHDKVSRLFHGLA
jgi:hypothetical protein